jgi:hypothetical protein
MYMEQNKMNVMTKQELSFETAQGRKWLQDALRVGPATITFTKKDGETRVMTCTLVESAIPEQYRPKPQAEGQERRRRSNANLSVWDINAQGWRSFIFSNVTKVEF